MQTTSQWPTTYTETSATKEQFSWPHAITAFALGFGAILYIPIAGDIKIVDLCALLAWTTRITYLRLDNRALFFLIASFVVVCFAGLNSNYADTDVKPYLAGLAALACAHVVVSMRSYEIRVLLAGLAIGTSLVLLWTALAGYLPIPTFGINLRYHSRFGQAYTGTMTDPNRFCLVLLVTLALIVSLAITQKRALRYWLWATFVMAGIYLTQSRAGTGLAILTAALGGGIFITKNQIVQTSGMVRKLVPIFLIAALVLLSIRTMSHVRQVNDNFRSSSLGEKVTDKAKSLENDPRWQMAKQGLSSFLQSPLGLGIDGYVNKHRETSHNSYIELAVNGGFMGIALYLVSLWFIGKQVIRALDRRYNRNHASSEPPGLWYGYFGLLCFVIMVMFQVTMQVHYLAYAYIILGVLANPLLHLETPCTRPVIPTIR